MRKLSRILILTMILTLVLASNAWADSGIVSGGVVNLRSGPGTQYELVGTLSKDTRVEVIQSRNGWQQIQYGDVQGWITGEYLTVTQSPKLQVTGDMVNLRSGPGANYPKVGQAKKGEILTLVDTCDQWYQIRTAAGLQAYISANYITTVNTGTSISPAQPAPTQPSVPALPGKTPAVFYNGQKLAFDVPPMIDNSRTMVPLRAIFEAMGATVTWNQSTQTAIAVKGDTTVILPLNSTTPTINGTVTKIDVPAKLTDQRILAPLRFVGEAFGGTVGWDQASYTIDIQLKEEPAPPPEPVRTNLVVIDPGHGGTETGTIAEGVMEKDITLDIGLRVGNILRNRGIPVQLTRTEDVNVGLQERADLANELNAAIFVSIHCNSFNNVVSGTETLYYAPESDPELFAMKAERQELAQAIQDQLIASLMRKNRGAKEDNLSVLRNTKMPSALAEVMFLDNPEERALLLQDSTKQQAAEAIATGIQNFMQR